MWAGELSRCSASRAYLFTGLRRLSKLERAQLKLFSLGGSLVELSLATYRVRFGK